MRWLNPGRWLLILAVLASLGVLDRIRTQHHRELGRQDILMLQRKAASLAQQASDDKERHWQNQLTKATQDATKLRTQLAADAAVARTVADSLRNDLGTLRAYLPTLTRQAVEHYANAASVVFLECSQRYAEMAAKADGHAADQQTLTEGWPQ